MNLARSIDGGFSKVLDENGASISLRPMLRCHNCGWEGEEAELVEKPGNLMFYDYMAQDTFKMEVTRINGVCPKCGETLRSKRLVGGVSFDK